MKMIKTTLTKTIMAKTITMETSNTLLNTISAQITYTRGALIALFAGLFILAACGGNALVVVADDGNVGGTDTCATNIFDSACGVEKQAERTSAINACITAIRAGEAETCDKNIPMEARDCLNAPFTTEGCSEALASDRVSVTIETVQETRKTDCRADTVSGEACTGAIVNVCGAVDTANDGVLFTETLCGEAYDASRTTLINNCRTGVEAGQDRDVACGDVVITTDDADNKKALDCVLDPFAEGCDTNTDVMNVVEKTDDTIESIDDVKMDSVAFCRGASDFATNSLCENAIKNTCADNPFTQTTTNSPFCTGANDGRAALITRCSDTDTDCDKVVSTGVTVAVCVATPHATGCGDTAFNGLRTARYTHCTGASPTDDCALVETTILCLADTAKASTRANPFSPLCRASSADYTTAQSEFCTARAGENLDECTTGFLTTCDENPLVQTCIDSGLYTEAGKVRTTLCTTDATLFDDRCNGFTNTVTSTDIATTRDNICNTEATSFHAGCLDRTGAGLALDARKAFIQTCIATPSTACDVPTSSRAVTVTLCIKDPHRDECKDDLDFAEVKSARTTLCTDTTDYFDTLCDTYENIDTTRETRCTEGATSFDAVCDGQGYDADRTAGQKAFIKECRASGEETCGTIMITTRTGPISIAECVNKDANDPWKVTCQDPVFEAERTARSLECATFAITTNINNTPCANATRNDSCVENPFIQSCNAEGYDDVRDNRDTYCRDDGRTDGDPLCIGRQTYICDGTEAMGDPFADICGTANHVKQIAFCGLGDGSSLDICESDPATVCSANPFNGSFGAYQLDCRDAAYYPNRITACSGAINALPDGGTIDDCAVTGVADVICGTGSGDGSNPFAPICAESEATSGITGFNQVMEQQRFCGTTRVTTGDNVGDCATIYTGLCTGADLLNPAAGEGDFNCLMDDDGTIMGLRNGYCTDPATSFTKNCEDGTHGDVNDARKSLAETCRNVSIQTSTGCNEPANGVVGGRTVVQCSGNDANGDPYHADCVATAELRAAFADEQADRAETCGMDANANEDFCMNAIKADKCIGDPFGNDKAGMPCSKDTYATARFNRDAYCGSPSAGANNPLCTNNRAGLCDGEDDNDKPFALTCGTDNSAAQNTWCGRTIPGALPECANNHAGACAARPFGTNVAGLRDTTQNCLTHGNGLTYRSHRQSLCALGTQDVENTGAPHNCDTTEIAPVVCATSSDANYNPFAAFCKGAANDGQEDAALLMSRQTVLSQCTNPTNAADAVCVNSVKDIRELNTACGVVGATSVMEQCAYTEYFSTQEEYCTNIKNGDSDIFDGNCTETTHGEVLAARQTECSKTGTSSKDDGNVFCPDIVRDICIADNFKQNAAEDYLCGADVEGVNYVEAREATCATRLTTGDDVANCDTFLDRLCTDNEFGMAGSQNYDCAGDITLHSKREELCGADGTGSGGTLTNGECTDTITRICVDAELLSSAVGAGGYDCAGNETRDVLSARRAHCAEDGVTTAGCPDVLTMLCTGANSLLALAKTGVDGTTFNCAKGITYLPQRREYCARTGNDNASGCPPVLTELCASGNSVEIEVATDVDGKNYNCSTSTVTGVELARKTHCRLSTSHGDGLSPTNSGGLCAETIATLCTADPFESVTGGASASLCVDASSFATYKVARETACQAPRPTSGETNFENCNIFLTGICTGKEFGTAGVRDYDCAADGEFDSARETRCGTDGDLDNDGNLDSDCTATITRICVGADLLSDAVGAGGYNCAGNETDDVLNARRGFCATSAGTSGCPAVLATLCMKDDNSVRIDAPTGVDGKAYSCVGNTTAEVIMARQTECKTRDNDDGLCTPTITDFCGTDDNNPTTTNNLFDLLCRVGYETARDNACLDKLATAGANNGDNSDCNNRQAVKNTCMRDPFTKDGCDNVEGRTDFVKAYCTTGATSFHVECLEDDIDNYGDVDGTRDDYCLNTAIPADGNAAVDQTPAGNCYSRKAGICGTSETHNPFANLCSEDEDNITTRQMFCENTEPSGGGGHVTGVCSNDRVVLCTANPFGTSIGSTRDIDCTTGEGDYSDNRERLAEACRTGDTPPAGTTCTPDINACNENPFSTTAFGNAGCDAAAFAGAFVQYCTTSATSFTDGCIDGTHGDDGAVDAARKTFIVDCRASNGDAAGCKSLSANGKSGGPTVAQCSLNPFNTEDPLARSEVNDVCNTNPLFEAERMARIELCEVADNSFNELCKNLDVADTDKTRLGGIAPARTEYCTETAQNGDTDCNGDGEGRKTDICNGDEVTDNPYALICDGNNLEAKKTFCGISGNSEERSCPATIVSVCDVETGNPFDTLCPTGDNTDRITRANACRLGSKSGNDKCPTEVVTCNAAPFGAGCDTTIYAGALEAFCTKGADIFDTQCVNTTHGAVTAARLEVCKGAIASLPANAPTNACSDAELSGKICGDATTIGSKPFAEICSDMNRNSNHAVYIDAQRNACRSGDISREECRNTIAGFCGTPRNANVNNLFDTLCLNGDTYNSDRTTFCTEGETIFDEKCNNNAYADTTTMVREAACRPDGKFHENEGCGQVRRTFCGDPKAPATAVTFDSLCDVGYETARGNACTGLTMGVGNCEDTITRLCTENPFTQTTTGKDNKNLCVNTPETDYDMARADACRMSLGTDGTFVGGRFMKGAGTENCAPVIEDACGGAAGIGNARSEFKVLFSERLCTADYTAERVEFCNFDNPVGDALTICRDSNLLARICNGDDTDAIWNPYADICAESTATENINGFDLAAKRQEFRGLCGMTNTNSHCSDVIADFCSSASDVQLFESLCNTGYTDERVAACNFHNENNIVHSTCGNVISTNCPTNGDRNPACAPLVDTLPASFWETAARNENNSGTLNVLDAVGLNDAYTNYVKGTATGLQLGAVDKGDGTIKDSGSGVTVTFENGTVSFADLDHLAGAGGENGAAFAFIDFADSTGDSFTDNPDGRVDTRGRYYAGLFSGTDLGGPLPDTTTDAIWNAAFAGYSSGGSVVNNFTVDLRISYTDKKIETIDRVVMGNGAGSISIAGKFTDAGVIYGTSSWRVGTDSATGTVTGLIGVDGAVGAFVSSGENDDTFEYAGGFVAAPVTDAICHDGTTDLPFHRLCDEDDSAVTDARNMFCDAAMANAFAPRCAPYTTSEQKTTLANTCRTAPQTAGCRTVLGDATTLTVNDCTNTDNGHPHQAGCEDAGFTAQRVLRIGECVMTGNEGLDKCTRSGITAVNDFCKVTPFDADCEVYAAHYTTARTSFIAGCGESTITRGTIGVRDCSHLDILAALCVADGKPVSFLCDGYSVNSADITTLRQDFCRDDMKGVDVRCVPTRKQFCDANLDSAMIFDALCDDTAGTYSVARGAQCALTADAGAATALNNGCGEEDVSGYLQAFCDTAAGANNVTHCPIKFAAKPDDGVDTAVWEDTTGTNGARNSDNTSRLTILDSVGVGDTFDTNYVKAGTDGLEIAGDVTHTTPIKGGVLMLSEAGTTNDLTSGVAFARIDGNFASTNKVKYYAGILSGTDLGAPVTNTGTDVRWATAISIVIDDEAIQEIKDTGLYIDFTGKTIKSKNARDAFDFLIGGFTHKFFIDAKFTTAGIVYGTTKLGKGRGAGKFHSDGTLTGLIGNKGLVAAFVSDGVNNTNEYVGGFVAVNPNPVGGVVTLDCSATGFLFDTTACAEDSHRDLRVSLCENRNTVILPAGINTADDCNTAEVKAVICAINRNPFDTICDGAYTEVRGEWCVANTGQRLDQCGDAATPNSYIASYCRDTRPLATICDGEAGAEDGLYAVQRHTRCAPEAVKSNPLAVCVPVIDRLCNAEPFNITAGEGTTTINCVTAIDAKYATARQNRIRLCADGTQSGDSRCMQESVTAITSVCTDNPFATTCADYPTQYATQRVKRIAFCEDTVVDNSIHMDCTNSDVAAVLTTCKTTDPFDPVCTPFAVQYTAQRTQRLNDCLTPTGDRTNTDCANADAPICSGYSPFDAICVDTNNNEARIRAALACAPDNTRDEDYVPPALCDTIVTTAAIAAVTVKDCIKDPLNKKCNGTAAIRISDCRADAERQVAACNVRLASGVTIRDCIEDSMNERCNGEVAIGISDCRADSTREVDGCNVVISAEVPSVVSTKKVSDCVADPWNAECPQDIFDNIVKAAVCETSTTSFTAGCLDPANGFIPAETRTRLTPSQNARRNLIQRCADTDRTDSRGCNTMIAGGKTLDDCIANPFDDDCRGEAVASALAASSDAVKIRDMLVGRCEAFNAVDATPECNTIVADGKTIEFCTKNLFHASCSGDGLAAAFNSYRAPTCLDPATSFTVGCDEATYAGTHAARAELALGCADDPMGAGCKTIIVSGSLTVDMCNADPFATGCESPAFIHARLEACKGDVPHATCNVGGAIADNSDVRTGYVAGGVAELELGTATSEAGIVKHTSTLNDVGYAQTDDGVYTDQSASGFALVYIPDVRDGDQRVTSPSRYFAGLLSGTDVGGPLQDGFATASWDAKLTIVSQGLFETVDFKLKVDFDAKTIGASDTRTFATSREETYVERDDVLGIVIKTRTVQDREERTVNYAYTTLGQFVIAGKFTADGVIYGTTGLSNDAAESSRGTLTGIIGQNGAVGAFVSSGAGRFVNTLGEYAGGFVAAPALDCATNPLDIRCNEFQYHEAREDACSGSKGWRNPACDPVFARVCAMDDNLFSATAMINGTVGLDCLTAPKIHEDRKSVCDGKIDIAGSVPGICTETVRIACEDNLFDDDEYNLCYRSPVYQQEQYEACAHADVRNQIFNPSTTSAVAEKCFNLISLDCGIDPFDNRFCYISNNYNNIRADKCSDHNFAATKPACTGINIVGVGGISMRVSVIDTYCGGLNGNPDAYNLCGNTPDYVQWRNAENNAVTGWNAAEADDKGLIAGGETKLNLGGTAQDIHNEITLTLRDSTTNGVAIASAMVDGQLQSYGGLLSGADVGIARPIPSISVGAAWSAQIALLWQDGDNPNRTTILRNEAFVLRVTFAPTLTHVLADDILLTGADNAKFTLVGVQGTAGLKLVTGKITLQVGSNRQDGNFRGLVGNARLLAAFASTGAKRTGANAFAGGLIAEQPLNTCVPDGTGNPITGFDNNCSDAQKRDEATRCYNERGNVVHTGDCIRITDCFANSGSNLFGSNAEVRLPDNSPLRCTNPIFEGARAVYCLGHTDQNRRGFCGELIGGSTTQTRADGGFYNVCIGRPFGAGCEVALGSVAFAQSRLAIASDCMTGDNSVTKATGACQRFIARVGAECATNPFGVNCAARFEAQVNDDFADVAQTSRLSHCTATGNEASGLCTGALTYCAVDSPALPDGRCGTLVTDYCLGGAARRIIGRADACTAKLATTCDVDPFNPLTRCVQEYADARQNHCDGTMTVEGLSLDKCLNTGLDADICGDMDSLGSNPFAEVCKSATSNANFTMLDDAKEFYCRDGGTDLDTPISVSEPNNCASFVTSTCGTGGFGYTTNLNNAFDPLCRQETYNYARFAACGGDKNSTAGDGSYYTGGCGTFIDTVCPAGTVGTLTSCKGNENSTPISVWTDNVSGILAEGEARRIGGTVNVARFAQAGADSLDLSDFDGTPAQYKITLEGDEKSGVAFANSLRTYGGALQLFAGLLRGTNVGGPLLNNTADGEWTGKVSLAIGRGGVSPEGNFTLRVAFTGNGGTLTTHTSATADTFADDIDLPTVPDAGGLDRFTSLRLRIDGAFTAEGVISGTTHLYGSNTNEKTYAGLQAARAISTATLTGLIGKAGAVGAFHTTRGAGNLAVYIGGFTAIPDTADNPYVVGDNCTIGGASRDTGNFLFSSACDYATTARALWCGGRTGGDSYKIIICREEAIQKLVCKGTGEYANPFTSLVCRDYPNLEASQLTFANQCDAGTATGDCTASNVAPCLTNPYNTDTNNNNGVSCSDDPAFANIRTVSRPRFCNILGNEAKPECAGALAHCAITTSDACGSGDNFVSRYCLADANQMIAGGTGFCFGSIQAECSRNPFNPRCVDSLAKNKEGEPTTIAGDAFAEYDAARQTRCDGFSKEYLTTADRSVLDACNAYAPAICGYYVAAGDLLGPRERTDNCGFGGDREPQGEVIEIGSNPLAAICTNEFANRDRRVELTKDEGGICPHAPNTYNQTRQGSKKHKDFVLAQYRLVNCPETATAVARLTEGCDVINVAGGDGYEAWETAVGDDLITAGDAANATEKTNFIAGYGGGLFLGVGTAGAVANADTFTIPGTASGFAYATTGTEGDIKLFTGLLSGTTDLGGFYTSEVEVTWRSTLSFLTNQSGSIAAITKEGFILTVTFDGTDGTGGTITGIENVGTGMVFQVAGTFTGTDNLLSGTVTFGATESGLLDSNAFASGGSQTTGILTGIIGADGTVGVFKSNTEGSYGDFVGGFVVAPPAPATETVWARSFHGRGGNAALALHSHGLNITGTSIADGARAYIRLNANNQAGLVNFNRNPVDTGGGRFSSGSRINTIAFFNNNGLVTPDKGDSGVTFGQFERTGSLGNVSLAGLWPTTNMGLPLTAEPTTAIWRGKISAIYAGKYTGERDVRFTIGYDGPGGTGTVKTTEKAFLVVEPLFHQYIHIDAQFDRFGAVFGTTRIEQIEQIRGRLDNPKGDGAVGTVSGLIGEKGLIGAFVSTKDAPGLIYLGGFYALNPDAERAEVSPGAATNAGLWESSLLPGGVNFGAAGRFVVNKFGVDADVGQARFARFGTGDYIAADSTDNSQALSFSFDEDSGVGFGKVDGGYYSGLLAGANAGISLGPNQKITTAATWTGKIALYGAGSAGGILPSSAEQDLNLEVTFDGTEGRINTITGNLPKFGQWSAGDRLDYTLTITGKFNVAGVISGTTSFYGAQQGGGISGNAQAVSGVLTGLIGTRSAIGTRGAIGSFISTGAIGDVSAGAYAGGFVVEKPDNTFIPEVKPAVLGDDVLFSAWVSNVSPKASSFISDDRTLGTFFIQGTAGGITDLRGGNILTLKVRNNDTDLLVPSATNKVSYGRSVSSFAQNLAGLLAGADVGGALQSAPATAVWVGEIGAIAKVNATALAARTFYLKIEFGGAGLTSGAVGRIWSTDATGAMGSMALGHPQKVGDQPIGKFRGSAINFGLTGTFNAAGVMTGTVRANDSVTNSDGVFNGLIGGKGALGVFKSNVGQPYIYAGGFTASNPNFGVAGATDDYNRWRSSFDGAGLNGRVKNPSDTATTVANPLQPRGVNVNQFLTGTTHFVQGEADGLNLTGSNKVTGNSFTPTLLKLDGNDKVGFALWQGDVNVEGADNTNTQGYVGLLIGTEIGESPSSFVGATYTGKIIAYVGDTLSDETDFTLTIDYNDNFIDGSVTLEGEGLDITEFTFDGIFNIRGVISGDVLTGVQGADGIQGSFNGLIGTKAAVGVFKNTAGNTGVSFIGGFVAEPSVVFDAWVGAVNPLGAGDTNQRGVSHQGYFIRGSADGINGINTTVLTLESDANSGIAFGERVAPQFSINTYYTGLLSGTNVGRHIDNENLNAVWTGQIQAYVNDGNTLTGKSTFYLDVEFGASGLTGDAVGKVQSTTAVTNGVKGPISLGANRGNIHINGTFNRSGVMSGSAIHVPHSNNDPVTSNGVFNGLIGTLGAVGVFRDNNDTGADAFIGGFIANPPTK